MYCSDVYRDNYRFIWSSENNFPYITSSVWYKLIVYSYMGRVRSRAWVSPFFVAFQSLSSNDSCQQNLVVHSRHIPWRQTQTVTIDNKLYNICHLIIEAIVSWTTKYYAFIVFTLCCFIETFESTPTKTKKDENALARSPRHCHHLADA